MGSLFDKRRTQRIKLLVAKAASPMAKGPGSGPGGKPLPPGGWHHPADLKNWANNNLPGRLAGMLQSTQPSEPKRPQPASALQTPPSTAPDNTSDQPGRHGGAIDLTIDSDDMEGMLERVQELKVQEATFTAKLNGLAASYTQALNNMSAAFTERLNITEASFNEEICLMNQKIESLEQANKVKAEDMAELERDNETLTKVVVGLTEIIENEEGSVTREELEELKKKVRGVWEDNNVLRGNVGLALEFIRDVSGAGMRFQEVQAEDEGMNDALPMEDSDEDLDENEEL
ncbi:hypothetical protein BDW74DRAFT_142863 [Aspergillus multicolor]|uniref:uncharacterized protein n=1 Tax=Aspergillus multicolor TaxID=41759 RepID=UPI003CCD45AC